MSTISEALKAIQEVLKLTDDVKRAGETLKQMSTELLQHDRRITRLEAQWDTALQFGKIAATRHSLLLKTPNNGDGDA